MVGESLAIVAVIFVMAAMLARAGKHVFAAFTMPLISIPVVHLIGVVFRLQSWMALLDVIGLLVGLGLCFLLSRAFRSKKARVGYLVFCGIFLVALLAAYLMNLG